MRCALLISLVVAFSWLVPEVSAQTRARISRPSDQTGSSILGRVGGSNTGSTSEAQSIGGNPTPAIGAGAPLAIPGLGQRRGSGFYAGNLAVGSITIPQFRNPALYSIGQRQLFEARALSGMGVATNPRLTADSMVGLNYMPPLQTPVYLRESVGTKFHSVFGLTPAVHSDASIAFPEQTRQIDLINADLARREQQIYERALQRFQEATDDRPRDERIVDLKNAQTNIRTALQLDVEAYETKLNLCLLHASLELEQIVEAMTLIDRAIQGNPNLLIDRESIASLFGDFDAQEGVSKRLDRQLRRYIVTADYNPESVEALILSGYCAVHLGDWRRLDRAITELDSKKDSSGALRNPINRFLWAAAPVLDERP